VRVISKTRLKEFWTATPAQSDAHRPLALWYDIVSGAAWKSPVDVKQAFGANVDLVKVSSGNTVFVFDIHGNKYRLIAAIHFLQHHRANGRVYVLRIMTHAEYDKEEWKRQL
jgi:mRNA interferase HigB